MRGGCDELNTNSCGIFYHNDNHIFAEPRECCYCLPLVFNIVLICFFGMGEKMMKSFDEWINENGFNFRPEQYDLYKYLYEAGQQSKQAEVDELRREILNKTNEAYADGQKSMRKMIKSNENELYKRIDEIENHVEINYDCERSDDNHSYWSGYNQAMRELFEILKGEHK